MPSFPIVPGQVQLPATWQPIAVTVVNTSATNPASVTITGPDGAVVWACQLAPNGSAVWNQAQTSTVLAAGLYTLAVTGTVVGTVTR